MIRPMSITHARSIAPDATLRGDGRWWATGGATCFWVAGDAGIYRPSLDAQFARLIPDAPVELAKIGRTYIQDRGVLGVYRLRDMSGILYRARFLEAAEEEWPDLAWYAPDRIGRRRDGHSETWAAARVGDRWVAFVAPVVTKIEECRP